jgi:hypothetical protein
MWSDSPGTALMSLLALWLDPLTSVDTD